MAAIRAYTDISQSKKLAEILPHESADMYYREWKRMTKDIRIAHVGSAGEKDLSCWSLSALLGVLPKNLNIGRPSLESNYKEYYWIQYYDEFMEPNNYKTECFNNPVDACVDMIEKLHELNLL